MDSDNKSRKYDPVYSKRVRAGKRRTYFFDVRETKGKDYFITLTESTRKYNSEGYERHKIFLYKEDFNRFLTNLQETIDYIKNELLPEYDYDEFDKKHEEWEKQQAEEAANAEKSEQTEESKDEPAVESTSETEGEEDANKSSDDIEEDISW